MQNATCIAATSQAKVTGGDKDHPSILLRLHFSGNVRAPVTCPLNAVINWLRCVRKCQKGACHGMDTKIFRYCS